MKDIIVKTTDKAEHDDTPETNVRLILETTAIDFLFSTQLKQFVINFVNFHYKPRQCSHFDK